MLDLLLLSTPPKNNEFGVNLLQMELTAAYLARSGFSTEILECTTLPINMPRLVKLILFREINLLACFTAPNTVLSTLRVVRKLRDSGWSGHISLLGDYASKMYRTLLGNASGIDSIVIGRDDQVLAELASMLRTKQHWGEVAGLAYYRLEQGIVVNQTYSRNVHPVTLPAIGVPKIRA